MDGVLNGGGMKNVAFHDHNIQVYLEQLDNIRVFIEHLRILERFASAEQASFSLSGPSRPGSQPVEPLWSLPGDLGWPQKPRQAHEASKPAL